MAGNTRASGRMTGCMVEEYSLGQTEDSTLVAMLMTKNKGLANILGLAVDSIKASGSTGSNMVMENLLMLKVKVRKEFGTTAKYYNGYKIIIISEGTE
jgi:hypothetical protein